MFLLQQENSPQRCWGFACNPFKKPTWWGRTVSLPSPSSVGCCPSQSQAGRISACGTPDLAAHAGTQVDFCIWHRLIMCLALLCFVCEGPVRGQVSAKQSFAAWHRLFLCAFTFHQAEIFLLFTSPRLDTMRVTVRCNESDTVCMQSAFQSSLWCADFK